MREASSALGAFFSTVFGIEDAFDPSCDSDVEPNSEAGRVVDLESRGIRKLGASKEGRRKSARAIASAPR